MKKTSISAAIIITVILMLWAIPAIAKIQLSEAESNRVLNYANFMEVMAQNFTIRAEMCSEAGNGYIDSGQYDEAIKYYQAWNEVNTKYLNYLKKTKPLKWYTRSHAMTRAMLERSIANNNRVIAVLRARNNPDKIIGAKSVVYQSMRDFYQVKSVFQAETSVFFANYKLYTGPVTAPTQ